MNCQRCGKPITEQTFAIYARRCVPCFRRMPFQRVRLFFTEAEFLFVIGLLLIPVFIACASIRRLWHRVRPVPFKRQEIIHLMTPHFWTDGATDYVNGFRRGFLGSPPRMRCGYARAHQLAQSPSRSYIIGREDGEWLCRAPNRLRQILDRRCSAPFRTKSRLHYQGALVDTEGGKSTKQLFLRPDRLRRSC